MPPCTRGQETWVAVPSSTGHSSTISSGFGPLLVRMYSGGLPALTIPHATLPVSSRGFCEALFTLPRLPLWQRFSTGEALPLEGIREICEGGFHPQQLLGIPNIIQWVGARKAMPGRVPPRENCQASHMPPDVHVREKPVYLTLQLNSGLHMSIF